MTGNRTPVPPHRPFRTLENTATSNTHRRSRRTDSAPPGIGVKTTPATRVDLRSSLDPDPLPAFIRTEPSNAPNRSQPVQPQWLTRPHSYRDDTEGSHVSESIKGSCWAKP